MEITRTIIKILFFLTVASVWAIVGFVFWLALLLRAVTAFTATFLYAMLTGQSSPLMADHIDAVADVWIRGFRSAYDSVFGSPKQQPLQRSIGRLVLEVSWTTVFLYYTAVFTFLPTDWTYLAWGGIAVFLVGLVLGFAVGRKDSS